MMTQSHSLLLGGIDGKHALQRQSDFSRSSFSPIGARVLHRGRISLGEGGVGRAAVIHAAAAEGGSIARDRGIGQG